jgi:methionyl-tRNA formyltransferase
MKISFIFFGTSDFATIILDELQSHGYLPDLIITTPDTPQGRKLVMTPPPVKMWADKNSVHVLQPATLKDAELVKKLEAEAPGGRWDVFVVASYGKIIPKTLLDMPKHQVLNVHPSLLPKYRGASPLQSAILDDAHDTGVTIMRLDEEMDHGPIVATKKLEAAHLLSASQTPAASTQSATQHTAWPPTSALLKKVLGQMGGTLLATVLPKWIDGSISETPQDHSQATYTKKIDKKDGLINLSDDPYKNFLKIQAFSEWPKAYFFIKKDGTDMRVIISSARFADGILTIERVIPEGKREMNYVDFQKGYLKA